MGGESSEAEILLVEDNPGDVRLVEEAFLDGEIANTLHSVTSGEAALEFINRDGEYEDAPPPDVVLLDLNLPKMDEKLIDPVTSITMRTKTQFSGNRLILTSSLRWFGHSTSFRWQLCG